LLKYAVFLFSKARVTLWRLWTRLSPVWQNARSRSTLPSRSAPLRGATAEIWLPHRFTTASLSLRCLLRRKSTRLRRAEKREDKTTTLPPPSVYVIFVYSKFKLILRIIFIFCSILSIRGERIFTEFSLVRLCI
jgi:hypothetical protein